MFGDTISEHEKELRLIDEVRIILDGLQAKVNDIMKTSINNGDDMKGEIEDLQEQLDQEKDKNMKLEKKNTEMKSNLDALIKLADESKEIALTLAELVNKV